jgi:hypothetical protein
MSSSSSNSDKKGTPPLRGLAASAISNPNVTAEQKDRIVRVLRAQNGNSPTVKGTLLLDAAGKALVVDYHADFAGMPHAEHPTPHFQIVFVREAGSLMGQSLNLTITLDAVEIDTLLTQLEHPPAGRQLARLIRWSYHSWPPGLSESQATRR